MKRKRPAGVVIAALVLLGAAFAGGWFAGETAHRAGDAGPLREIRLGGYQLINPLLECDTAREAIESSELQPFKYKLESYVQRILRTTSVSHVSVYFREMNNGLSFGIHEREKFSPASLVKLPLMMAYFKAVEADPHLLAQRITYPGGPDNTATQRIRPSVSLVPGRSYTVDELIRASIVYSDNNAYFLLYGSLNPRTQKKVYSDLGLDVPKVRTMDDYMTVDEFSSFFRILFNASYLTRELSEKALGYLAEAEFKDGLVAGVPPGITVSHKFGERSLGDSGEIKQLHDCGIVYYPGQPYLLCIMSRGTSFEFLDVAIRDISRMTFEAVDRQYRGR